MGVDRRHNTPLCPGTPHAASLSTYRRQSGRRLCGQAVARVLSGMAGHPDPGADEGVVATPRQRHGEVPGGGGNNLRVFFYGRANIRGGNIWNGPLEMKENFGIRSLAVASKWMATVISWWPLDGC